MKRLLLILFALIGQLCFANMASPLQEGTHSSSAFSSRDIDILREKISIMIDKKRNTASYVIEYFIRTETDGSQIPLLFHAQDYLGNFRVWVDNVEVQTQNIPSQYFQAANSPFEKFSNIFSGTGQAESPQTVTINWSENDGYDYSINDLKYFETRLIKGEHTIRVEYVAEGWKDRSNWVSDYSFRYSLSPAKFWKSFGSLEITIDGTNFQNQLTTDLGQPTMGRLDSVAVWTFQELPAEYFQFNYTPSISSFADTMIAIGPVWITAIFGLIMAILNLFLILKLKRNNPGKKYSWVVIVSSIIMPLVILIFYMYSFDLIDNVIGIAASRYHGYTFLALIFYPVLAPLYGLGMWFFGKTKTSP